MPKRIEAIKKQFAKFNLYKQGGAVRILTGSIPWKTVMKLTVKSLPILPNYIPFGVYYNNDFFDIYFSRQATRRIADFYFHQEQNLPGFTARLYKNWFQKQAPVFLNILRAAEKCDLKSLNNQSLIKLFLQFTRAHEYIWREAIFLDAFDAESEEIIKKEIKKENLAISDENLHALTAPARLSWAQKEKNELIKITEKSNVVSCEVLKKMLIAHAGRYHWILNDYAVIRNLDWKFFLKQLQELLKNKKKIAAEKAIISDISRAQNRKQVLSKELQLSKRFITVTNFFTVLAGWRDDRKAYNQMANAFIRRFSQELACRTKLTVWNIEHLWWWEISDIFKAPSKIRTIIKKRQQGFFAFNNPEQPKNIFYGKEGKELQNFIDNLLAKNVSLQGRAAFPGIVRGKVKIIKTQNDFSKMKKGDILIAPNTRPEYVPIMKIARAIISEEGGLTCHTAIVARELKIPAIVGMQGAIAVLKDGDIVEVDANRGIVKIIKCA